MALINTTTTGILGTTVYGDGAGSLTVQKDGVTQGIYGNIPAFSAYLSVAQSISNNTWTKVQLNIEEFDTNSNYDNATNYRFTPTIAGYYQINGNVCFNATSGLNSNTVGVIYKNGTRYKDGNLQSVGTGGSLFYSVVSTLVYLNGTTDYIELWGLIGGTGTLTFGVNSGTQSFLNGFLVKAA